MPNFKPKVERVSTKTQTESKTKQNRHGKENLIARLRSRQRTKNIQNTITNNKLRKNPSVQTEAISFEETKPSITNKNLKTLEYQACYNPCADVRKDSLSLLLEANRFSQPSVNALEAALDDTSSEIRVVAAEHLSSFPNPLAEPILEKLISKVWDSDISVRKAVAKALANHPDPKSIGPLMGLLGTPDDELRYIVHQSLVKICEELGPPPPRAQGFA